MPWYHNKNNPADTRCWPNAWFDVGPPSATLGQPESSIGSISRVCWDARVASVCFLSFRHVSMQVQTTHWCSQQTQNICMTFVQCLTNVDDVGPTLYKCYANVLCLLGCNKLRSLLCPQFISRGLGLHFHKPTTKFTSDARRNPLILSLPVSKFIIVIKLFQKFPKQVFFKYSQKKYFLPLWYLYLPFFFKDRFFRVMMLLIVTQEMHGWNSELDGD